MDKSKYKYPRGEHVWTNYINIHGDLMFIVTTKPSSNFYYLYELIDNNFVKLGRGDSPPELENRFNVDDKLRQK